jgi:serine phosphatase RsbU (regulator of sigma subunit)
MSRTRSIKFGLSVKLLLISELVLLLAVLALLLPLRREMRKQVVSGLQNELRSIASTAALQLDGDKLARIRDASDARSSDFAELRDTLTRVRDANGIDFDHIYTFYRDGREPNLVRFGVMTHPMPFVGDPYELRPEMRVTFERGMPNVTDLYTDVNGQYISAYAPVRDRAGNVVALLEVDKPAEKYFEAYDRVTKMNAAVGLVVLAISSLMGWWVLNRIVIRPMRAVRGGMLALGRQDFQHRVRLRTRDEFQDLGETLNRMSEELNIARSVQMSFFPKDLPAQSGYRIAAATEPCDATAGDYVDAFRLDEDRVAILVADVTGHGLGPSLLMSACRSALRALATAELPPRQVIAKLDALLEHDLTDGRFITMIFGILDSRGSFTFTNAGHGPAMVISGERRIVLDAHRPPLGVGIDGDLFAGDDGQTTIALENGDRVFLCSDGVSEAMDATGEQFGVERLSRIVADRSLDVEAVITRVRDAIRAHSGRHVMKDDVTMLCVDRVSPSGWQGEGGGEGRSTAPGDDEAFSKASRGTLHQKAADTGSPGFDPHPDPLPARERESGELLPEPPDAQREDHNTARAEPEDPRQQVDQFGPA